jgi:hexosaminidase
MHTHAIIPQPGHLAYQDGTFTLGPEIVIQAPEALEPVAGYLAERMRSATGRRVTVAAPESDAPPTIALGLAPEQTTLGQEGYELAITPRTIRIAAAAPNGAFYACQSLLHLFPPEIERLEPVQGTAWTLPCLDITDSPRFPWRGMHLDVGRHFMPVDFITTYIDLLAQYKMNIFHWHLTEDQGWRIAIENYPKLTEIGAWRMVDGQRYGGFYTHDDIRAVVAYAHSRYVTVVPEIELPGHSVAALAAYPELSCTGGPFDVRTDWGIADDVYCAGNEQVFEFWEQVLTEVFELFPGPYVHIGGDECPKTRWRACPKCQERIRAEGLKDEDELQSYVIRRMERFISAHGKRLIGWDEILEGGLAPGAMVMSWRGMAGGITAAQAGHDVVMTPTAHVYFDYPQTPDFERLAQEYRSYLPLATVYAFEPVPAGIPADKAHHILGSQGNVWTERMTTPAQVEEMVLPRLCALAEVVWSQQARRDWDDFQARLASHYARFDILGLNYHGRR